MEEEKREEKVEGVYDIGYGFSNPCKYLQEALKGILKCLGLEKEKKDEETKDVCHPSSLGSSSGYGGGEDLDPSPPTRTPPPPAAEDPLPPVEDASPPPDPPPTSTDDETLPPSDDPVTTMDPIALTAAAPVARRGPVRGPISSGGPGQTN